MKNVILASLILGILFSCSSDDENQTSIDAELIGQWQLIETYYDPGDGSGTYESINSEKTIEIFGNGTFVISGPLCQLSTATGGLVMGNVFDSNLSDGYQLVSNENCDPENTSAEYGVSLGNADLIISYTACIEGCGHKYEKIN